MNEVLALRPVDAIEVTILVDNFVDDLLPSSELAQRPALGWDFFEREHVRAEHGYALLVTVDMEARRMSFLYDAGMGRDTAVHNLDVLGMYPGDLRAIVLSHGHADHHGGLEGLLKRLGRRRMPLVLHPDAWRDRKVVFPSGAEVHLPPPNRSTLEQEGVVLMEERGPSLLLDGAVLVTGQVERVTDFERGFPPQQARANGSWEPDPWLWDDQAVVLHLKEKGLVVLSSCSHAGVVNVLLHARRLTGIDTIYGFVGGLHLTGGLFEPIIPRTISELRALAPTFVVPGHCTGWKATHELARQLPAAYVQTSVGTRLDFRATGS